jgi:hypothetical protein
MATGATRARAMRIATETGAFMSVFSCRRELKAKVAQVAAG